ncbi:MAG: hypothetical protein DI551_00655 [Micavibrio aeruginosavorus]|uniref:Cyclodipeptide synthase n=1 Tax=Micavibrio aeruginosavorus TaxID=349221 RepID=A0A2W5N6Z8_9BACT|nr:MAG: hypothetical protein DI551_00655 [Micavibrio aeruginosavorus]
MRIKNVHAAIGWNGYAGSDIILPICARSPGARGRNFSATLDAMRGRIGTLHVVMCDTLDRHNLNGDAALAKSKADAWLAENLPRIRSGFHYTLKRWDDVRADPSFAGRHELMMRLYAESFPVQEAIDRISSHYVASKEERFAKAGLPFNRILERQAAAAYLVEEFAGTAVYKDWHPSLPEAYWGVYVGDAQIFNRHNSIDRTIDLALPETLAIHISRLPAPIAGERPRLAA